MIHLSYAGDIVNAIAVACSYPFLYRMFSVFFYFSQIKMSSPILNSVTIIGTIFLYLTVCCMGIDYPKVSSRGLQILCAVSNGLTKTYRETLWLSG